jgi:acetamidase/formamidase
MKKIIIVAALSFLGACSAEPESTIVVSSQETNIEPDYVLHPDQGHNKFSRAIEPVLRVPSGSVIEAYTEEATGGQLAPGSTMDDLNNIDWDLIHALTGPVYVEGAEPGDVLKVTLLELEPGDWGWTGVTPDFGFLAGEEDAAAIKTYSLDKERNIVVFSDGIEIPLAPFPGVMGVAPDTDEMLSTIPPRANGGNMDDPNMTVGTVVYFPVFVEGALFSVGDTHAVQGHGEVAGTAVEAPMRVVYRIEVLKGVRPIPEPQYETDDYYATTGFATTIDEAAKKATRYMIDYLVAEHELSRADAYMLCSLACDLKIAEVVDVPHMLVAMHVRKDVFKND